MKAAVLEKITNFKENREPLKITEIPEPSIGERDVLVKVSVCGVCHTELDEIEGRTPPAKLPAVPGHQVVGFVVERGSLARSFSIGDRVGIGWIGHACGRCPACLSGNENLCDNFKATGRDIPGGYAQYLAVAEDFAFNIPENLSDAQAAPLLCAGAIGYRSLMLALPVDGQNLGLTGFGASAHLVLKIIQFLYPKTKIFVFARNINERKFALDLGAFWAGNIDEEPPRKLHAIIDTTPAWKPVVEALKNLEPAGRLVINAIRKEETDKDDLMRLDYAHHLWLEKEIKSVANVTRRDVKELLALAARIPIIPEVEEYHWGDVNRALSELKEGKIRGAKVLIIN